MEMRIAANFNVPRFSENKDDIALAEKWLREQAQAQGWAKAQKLQVLKRFSILFPSSSTIPYSQIPAEA
jgi:hypothetical protein